MNRPSLNIMIVAGEPSGDIHAAHVAEAIKRLHPDTSLFGMGGRQMADVGVELIYDIADSAVMGFAEVLASVPEFYRKMHHLREIALAKQPDAVLLVDFPDFNMRLARQLSSQQFPIVYYIPPKAWAWRPWRAKSIARLTSLVISIFPFEAEFYRRAGANVEFVGHPLLDFVQVNLTQAQARTSLKQPGNPPIVALLPGSRRKELERLLPVMQEVAHRIHAATPETRFLLPLASALSAEDIPHDPLIEIIEGQTYQVLRAADLAIIASGTATLEAACIGTPMIILYKVSRSTWYIARWLVHLKHSGLPNIIAGDEIAPEFLQDRVNPDLITPTALRLLRDSEAYDRQRCHLAQVRQRLGEPGAVERAARLLLETAGLPC